MPETMQNESPKHQNVVNTRGKPGKNNANANRHEIQKKIPKRKKKEFPNQLRSHLPGASGDGGSFSSYYFFAG